MIASEPSPETTLVIILGASEWPKSPEFQASAAFSNSARKVRDYFMSPGGFSLLDENLLDLFDADISVDDIDVKISSFLEERISEGKKEGRKPFADVIVYFIGHGGFTRGHDYYLAIRRTRSDSPSPSSIGIAWLANTIKERARYLRRIIILDSCFAASAFVHFMAGPAQVATTQTLDAFSVPGKVVGFPSRGTSLLCSSRHDKPSLLTPDEKFTMFSEALVQTLTTGDSKRQKNIPLRAVCDLSEDFLRAAYGDEAPKPEVHSPDQSEGDVANIPFFPNPARLQTEESETTDADRESHARLEGPAECHKRVN